MAMMKNEGKTDRIVRMSIGLMLLLISLGRRRFGSRLKMGIPGLVLLITGATGHCGVYNKLGIDTLKGEESTPV